MSVLVHAMLVQALAGNAVIAKTPTDGGVACLTLACALAAREGIPRHPGQRQRRRTVRGAGPRARDRLRLLRRRPGHRRRGSPPPSPTSASATSSNRRDSTPGASGTTPTGTPSTAVIPKLFDYGKQRCTAYPRFVVQRDAVRRLPGRLPPGRRAPLRIGHPLAVEHPDDPLPDLDFGPLINAAKAKELADQVAEAIDRGAVPLHRGTLADARFLPGQDTSRVPPARSPSSTRPRPPRCTTRNPSARSTPSSWSTPRRNCSPR